MKKENGFKEEIFCLPPPSKRACGWGPLFLPFILLCKHWQLCSIKHDSFATTHCSFKLPDVHSKKSRLLGLTSISSRSEVCALAEIVSNLLYCQTESDKKKGEGQGAHSSPPSRPVSAMMNGSTFILTAPTNNRPDGWFCSASSWGRVLIMRVWTPLWARTGPQSAVGFSGHVNLEHLWPTVKNSYQWRTAGTIGEAGQWMEDVLLFFCLWW